MWCEVLGIADHTCSLSVLFFQDRGWTRSLPSSRAANSQTRHLWSSVSSCHRVWSVSTCPRLCVWGLFSHDIRILFCNSLTWVNDLRSLASLGLSMSRLKAFFQKMKEYGWISKLTFLEVGMVKDSFWQILQKIFYVPKHEPPCFLDEFLLCSPG